MMIIDEIFFCGIIKNYEYLTNLYGFEIIPISKLIDLGFDILKNYDLVLFDEFQRIRQAQFLNIKELKFNKVVFSIDQQQTIHRYEIDRDIKNNLCEYYNPIVHNLDKKIRQDKKMSNFILKFLNAKTKGISPDNYNNVSVLYFDSDESARRYLKYKYYTDKYIIIELTEFKTKDGFIQRRKLSNISNNIHEVVGKEYDNVAVVFDEHTTFNNDADLNSNYSSSSEYKHYPYNEYNSYFEALTRVREHLELVVVDNEEIYLRILEILNWWKDSYGELHDKISKLSSENKSLKEKLNNRSI